MSVGFGYRTGYQVGKSNGERAGSDIGDMLIAGFALAAGAGMFHGVVWMVKRLAKTTVEAEGVVTEDF